MANLNDYLTKNLDKSLAEMPFNELDYAILSKLSYLDLEGIVSEGCAKISFNDAYNIYKEQGRTNITRDTDEIFTKVANSARYKNLKLSHFKQTEKPETLEQFGAYALDIGLYHKAVFFRPTNGTLYSWKENFTVAYEPESETQRQAVDYFNKLAAKHPLQMFTLCGHSKGGNNAMYAGAKANLFNQTKIKQIINFDGPGFNSEFNPGIINKNLLSKVTTILPTGSIIGRLLDHKEKIIYVQTNNPNGIFEHEMNDWNVGETGFIRAEKPSRRSDLVDKKVREIVNKLNHEERKMLVDGVFGILENTGFTRLDEIFEDPKTLISAYFKSDKESRRFVRDVALDILRDRPFMKEVFGRRRKGVETVVNNVANSDKGKPNKKPHRNIEEEQMEDAAVMQYEF